MLGSVSRRKADLVSRSGLARASPMMVREADSSIGCNTRGLIDRIYLCRLSYLRQNISMGHETV